MGSLADSSIAQQGDGANTGNTGDAGGTISADTSIYNRYQTVAIATFTEQRGVSLKVEQAVPQSGMTYNPQTEELESGMLALKAMIQRQLFQGNVSQSSGAGASTEYGAYNANYFDGLRLITSGLVTGTYLAGATPVDVDIRSLTIAQAINLAVANVLNQGGEPSLVALSATAGAAFMNEQEGKQRVLDTELIPGVRVPAVNTVNGPLPLMSVPGTSALGTYTRASDGKSVEDIYVLTERTIRRRWIGSPDINVIEIPPGVGNVLTRTFLLFTFSGLQVADMGKFQTKCRIPQTLS